MNDTGEIVVVTGAAGAIGASVVDRLVRDGHEVAAVVRSAPRDLAGRAAVHPFVADVSDEAAVAAVFTSLDDQGRRPTAVVTCAGVNRRSDALDCTADTFMENVTGNLLGTFLVCREAAKRMRTGGGSIVTISSTMAFVGSRRSQVAYAASKGGVVAMTRALAVEWADYGIRVNSVAPTFIETPMNAPIMQDARMRDDVLSSIPLGRFGQPLDVANAVAWLVGAESTFVTGHVLQVDGGYLAR